MQNLGRLDDVALMDLLARETAHYTRMLMEGCRDEEFLRTTLAIKSLQFEINCRKAKVININEPAQSRRDAS